MVRIGICDDESVARDSLRLQLEKLEQVDQGQAEVIYEFNSGEGLVRWIEKHKGELDLIFLDVEMQGEDGIKAAHRIRNFDKNIMIVFLTGYTDFVLQGYQVDALDYIIKPAKSESLKRVIDKAVQRLADQNQYIALKNAEGIYRIYKEDIRYCYSQGRLSYLVLKEKELAFYMKLDELAERLGKSFVRIHQRYLVNSLWVDFIGKDSITLKDDVSLPISRSLREAATARLAKALLGDF